MWGIVKIFKGRLVEFAVGDFVSGFLKGSRDEIVTKFTNEEVTLASDMAKQLDGCKPWDNHLELSTLKLLKTALSKKDPDLARNVIDSGVKETAAPWCIDALKMACVFVCTKAPTIIKESLPTRFL